MYDLNHHSQPRLCLEAPWSGPQPRAARGPLWVESGPLPSHSALRSLPLGISKQTSFFPDRPRTAQPPAPSQAWTAVRTFADAHMLCCAAMEPRPAPLPPSCRPPSIGAGVWDHSSRFSFTAQFKGSGRDDLSLTPPPPPSKSTGRRKCTLHLAASWLVKDGGPQGPPVGTGVT